MKTITIGDYVIRPDICNGRERLTVYRKRERAFSAGIGDAYQTPSGYWIVSIRNQFQDVAVTRLHAVEMLRKAISARPETACP